MSLALFDLDGTLVDQSAASRVWAQEFGETRALDAAQVAEISERLAERRSKGIVFQEIVDALALRDHPQSLWRSYRQRMPELVRTSTETLRALRVLRDAGWTIGIVTNGEIDNQEGKIRRSGLAELVDGWVISAEVGVRKPDPAIFELAARRLGHRLHGWMIGDGVDSDIAGGTAAGLQTAWIQTAADDVGNHQPTIVAKTVATAVDQILINGAVA